MMQSSVRCKCKAFQPQESPQLTAQGNMQTWVVSCPKGMSPVKSCSPPGRQQERSRGVWLLDVGTETHGWHLDKQHSATQASQYYETAWSKHCLNAGLDYAIASSYSGLHPM